MNNSIVIKNAGFSENQVLRYCLVIYISNSQLFQPSLSIHYIFFICDFLPVHSPSKDLSIKALVSPSNLSMKSFLDVKLIKILATAIQVVAVAPDDHMDKQPLFISLWFLVSDFRRLKVLLARMTFLTGSTLFCTV